MDLIHLNATFPNIAPENLEEFKRTAAAAMEKVRGEASTLRYDWFFNADETSCVVREIYENSDAVLAHMGNLGDILGAIVELGGGLELEVFGDPSSALLEAGAAFAPTLYSPLQSK